ncbi:Down syndrome cell adhesion molecule-like protein 1 homolog, partial [Stylophora pistillata]|uniref:Down syndrome cell adhesion molecule-like protein 1 homolog n=1 Tax=Stylophora pistillata TaxID=50429 RepID=UPI000C05250E
PKVTLNFTDRSVTNSSLKVTWNVTEKPVGLNMPDKYEIESCAVDDSCKVGSCMNNTTSTNWYELLELRGASAYKFRDRAINLTARDGTVLKHPEGNFSEHIEVTTQEGAPTQAPLNVSAKPHSQTSIRITWNEVDVCHRNGKIVEYNVEMYNSTWGQKWYGDFNNTNLGEAIVENLVYAIYRVRARARTEAGEGPYSEWHNTTTHKP